MRVVGMDVHVRNSFLHATDGQGQLLRRGRVGNTLLEIGQFLASVGNGKEPLHVVMESTTNSRAMVRLLQEYGREAGVEIRAEVLHARKLRVIAETSSKCDRSDAATLNELARTCQRLPVCFVPDNEVFALREHLRARSDLVRTRTMLKNRLHATLHRRGMASEMTDLFGKLGRQWLAELKLDDAGRTLIDHYLQVIDAAEKVIDQSTADLNKLARSQRWCKQTALLRTMPGVGLITALTILAELGDINRFGSRAAVSNFAGIVPVVRNSDTKHYSGGITHRGPTHLRAALGEAAWTAIGKAPQYALMYHRISHRRGKQTAITAVARRMLEDAWTMLKREQVFRVKSVMPVMIDERISALPVAIEIVDDTTIADPSIAG